CVDEIEQPCNATIDCNITTLYPNNTALIDNQPMTHTDAYYYFTLNETSILGTYSNSIFCTGIGNGFSTFTFDINPTGKAPSETAGGFALATIIAMIAAAAIAFLIGHSFKQEDQKWYHLTLRAIFYMFSLGFVALGIGALNQLSIETDVSSSSGIGTIITGGVSLMSRMQYVFFIIIFLLAMLAIIYKVLTMIGKMGQGKSDYDRY
ncbi:unnamed protein product, partial [marine sediment metagenome]